MQKKKNNKKKYLLCFVYCVYNSGHWHRPFTTYFFFTVFTVSIPHKQTVFPHKLMESNANLFGKLLRLYSLLVWFQFTTDENRTTAVVLHVLYFCLEVRKEFSLNKPV